MQLPYQDRAARYKLQFPVEFLYDGKIVLGQCLNISFSGLLARFEEPLEVWSTGELRLHVAERSCKLNARVARVQGREAGLSFRTTGNAADTTTMLVQDLMQACRESGEPFTPPF